MEAKSTDQRIQQLRSTIEKERQLLWDIEAKLTDKKARRYLLKPPLSGLNMVEHYFLDAKILQETRPAARLTQWLRYADESLDLAIRLREHAEGIIKKFGMNARPIEG